MSSKQSKRMTSITRKIHFREMRKRMLSAFAVSIAVLVLAFAVFAVYHELAAFGFLEWEHSRYFSLETNIEHAVSQESELESQHPHHSATRGKTNQEDGTAPGNTNPEDGTTLGNPDPKSHTISEAPLGILQFLHQIPVVYYCIADSRGTVRVRAELFPAGLIILCPVVAICILRILSILLSWHKDNRRIRKILSPINELALRAEELSKLSFSEDKYQILEDAISHIDPDQMQDLSLGDADLAGVEAAMNNLLLRMKESYRQQARFVNDASHELRTPIAIIEGYANMLDRWGTQDEKVLVESIAAIKNESSHMKHLVEQLLFLARGDSGRTALQLSTVSLAQMMQEIYEESLMIDELHQYKYTRPAQDIFIQADEGLLKQAVRILVDNAAKYTGEHDEILLGTGQEDGHAYLQVQDTGIGMAESDIIHMFDRFYRSDEVRRFKGTGLGLSISKWIVDKHRGHFEITSRKDLGTRIRIVL